VDKRQDPRKGDAMMEIRRFISKYCPELESKYGFMEMKLPRQLREVIAKRKDIESLLLGSCDAEYYFSCAKGELLLEIRSRYDPRANNWYSFDLIRCLLTGESSASALMKRDNARLLGSRLSEIIWLFSPAQVEETLDRLDSLKDDRARSM
jgi:hypothetical protein